MKTWRKMNAAQWNKIKQSKTSVHAACILEFHVICNLYGSMYVP